MVSQELALSTFRLGGPGLCASVKWLASLLSSGFVHLCNNSGAHQMLLSRVLQKSS